MNKTKTLLALTAGAALAGIAPSSHAQSTITIYGILDAGIVREQGGVAGSVTSLSSGVASSSRIGFRGTEDLGGGWSASFVLENGPRLDTGGSDVNGSIFNRQAFVGLRSTRYGALTLGRQYTPYYVALSQVGDPFGIGYAGTAKSLFPAGGANTRTSNTLAYASPKFSSGFSADLSYALGEQQGSASAGRQIGFSLSYSAGALNARLAHTHRNNDLTAAAGAAQTPPVSAVDRDIGRNTLLAANYDFKVAKAFLAYGVNEGASSSPLPNTSNPYGGVRPTASTDSRDLLLGATFTFGGNTLIASWIDKDDRSARNQDAQQWAIGVNHALSRRTSAYASYGTIRNENGAGYTVGNNTDTGSGDVGYNVGVRHAF